MTVALSHWPTPLDPAPRLAVAVGLLPEDLLVKRDDLTDLGGGNKIRKLEHLLVVAEAAGATVLVTSGGARSNHARMTAAAAAPRGLRCVLVLFGDADPQHPGNLALEGLSAPASSSAATPRRWSTSCTVQGSARSSSRSAGPRRPAPRGT